MTSVEAPIEKTERLTTEQIRCPEPLARKLSVISTWTRTPIAILITPMLGPSVESLFAKVCDEMQKAKTQCALS